MKKLFFATLLFALVAGVTSCKKDDDSGESLVGTKWVETGDPGEIWDEETFEFKTASTGVFSVIADEGSIEIEEIPFTYTYTPPKVTITITIAGEKFSSTGTIDGNKLFIPEIGGEGEIWTFEKQ